MRRQMQVQHLVNSEITLLIGRAAIAQPVGTVESEDTCPRTVLRGERIRAKDKTIIINRTREVVAAKGLAEGAHM